MRRAIVFKLFISKLIEKGNHLQLPTRLTVAKTSESEFDMG
jgi:hypothetical protein